MRLGRHSPVRESGCSPAMRSTPRLRSSRSHPEMGVAVGLADVRGDIVGIRLRGVAVRNPSRAKPSPFACSTRSLPRAQHGHGPHPHVRHTRSSAVRWTSRSSKGCSRRRSPGSTVPARYGRGRAQGSARAGSSPSSRGVPGSHGLKTSPSGDRGDASHTERASRTGRWAEFVKAHAGIALESDATSARRRPSLSACSPTASPTHWFRQRLLPLLGIETSSHAEREELFTAWRRFLEHIADRRPDGARLRGACIGPTNRCWPSWST